MSRVADLRATSDDIVDASFALATVAIALWSFESAYGGTQFMVVGVIATALGVAAAYVCDRLGAPLLVAIGVWFALYVVVGGVLADPSRAMLGFIPTVDTMAAAASTMVEGWKELLTTVPPVGDSGDLMMLPVFCGLIAGAASMSIARRRSWSIGPALPSMGVLALGILCGTLEPVSLIVHGAVLAVLLLCWAAVRAHRRHPALERTGLGARRVVASAALLGLAAVVGSGIGDSMPLSQARDRVVWRDTFDPPFDPSAYPSPLGYYRHYVKALEDAPLFDVTGLPDGVPIRMATLDAYDGIVWKATGGTRALEGSAGFFERVGVDVAPDHDGPDATIVVSVPDRSSYDEVWMPTVGEVRSVSFDASGDRARELAESYRYNRTTDTAAMVGQLRPGDRYEMSIAVPTAFQHLDDDALLAEPSDEPIEGVPGPVVGLGSGHVEDIEGIERIQILVDYLRREGYYSSSGEDETNVPAGHGFGRLLQFADSDALVGNAEQYAATLGLILRNSAVPTRVVMGFVPRDYDPDGTITVSGVDAEAWVEVLVENVGWVAVFPTPDRTETDIVRDDTPKPIPDRETQVPPPPPVIEPDAETDPAGESEQVERERDDEEEEDDDESIAAGGTPWLFVIGGGLAALTVLVVVVPILLIVWFKSRRRRRRRSTGSGDERIANGWRELIDYAVDTGVGVPAAATRREAAALVGSSATAPRGPLEVGSPRPPEIGEGGQPLAGRARALAYEADAAVFGPHAIDDGAVEAYWSEVAEARRAIGEQLSSTERLRAALSLESFRRAASERGAGRAGQRSPGGRRRSTAEGRGR